MNIGIEEKNLSGMVEKILQTKIVIENCTSIGLKPQIGLSIQIGMVTLVMRGGIIKMSGGESRWNFSELCDRFVKEII